MKTEIDRSVLERILDDAAYIKQEDRQAIREAIAAPVPPAGDVEVLAWIISDEDGTIDATVRWDVAKHSFGHVTSMVSQTAHQGEVARLTADLHLERTRADVAVADCNDAEAAGRKVSLLLSERTAERDGLLAERLLLRDALDHIAKTCGQSRTDTRRLRWIDYRANTALEGKPYDAKLLDLPINGDKRDLEQRRKIERLQSELTKARELLEKGEQSRKFWADSELALKSALKSESSPSPIAHNADESCGQDAEAAKGLTEESRQEAIERHFGHFGDGE